MLVLDVFAIIGNRCLGGLFGLGGRVGLTPFALFLVVAVVGFHNACHKTVADNVFLVELHKTDAFDIAQDVEGCRKS